MNLTYDDGQGLIFRRTISVDREYLFTIKDSVENRGATSITLYPYGLISRHGTPPTLNYYLLHEGLIGVMGSQGLREETYKQMEEKKSEIFDATDAWLGSPSETRAALSAGVMATPTWRPMKTGLPDILVFSTIWNPSFRKY